LEWNTPPRAWPPFGGAPGMLPFAGAVVVEVVAALLDAAPSTVAPTAPPAIEPTTTVARTPLRITFMSVTP
jgi:hypothetical protein